MIKLDINKDFPQLARKINGQKLVYLDSAASSLKALPVIERLHQFNQFEAANVHRGAHYISNEGTSNYEQARKEVAQYLNAEVDGVVFTKGTTESINLVAQIIAEKFNEGDEIILSEMEHHSNIIPWQILAQKKKLKLQYIPVNEDAELDYEAFDKLVSSKTKLVAVTHVSNTLGTMNDIKRIIVKAKTVRALTLIDAAQSMTVTNLDVKDLDCDFLAFSGHKIFGPFGAGVLYGKSALLNELPPYQSGGSMIETVDFESSSYLKTPQRFEAGTPNVSGAIGLGEAVKYLGQLNFDEVRTHEKELLNLAYERLSQIPEFNLFSRSESCVNILSFEIKGAHSSDIGQILDEQGIAVRVGHHCTQLLMKKLGVKSTVRASLSVYNTEEDVDKFCKALIKAKDLLL